MKLSKTEFKFLGVLFFTALALSGCGKHMGGDENSDAMELLYQKQQAKRAENSALREALFSQ